MCVLFKNPSPLEIDRVASSEERATLDEKSKVRLAVQLDIYNYTVV